MQGSEGLWQGTAGGGLQGQRLVVRRASLCPQLMARVTTVVATDVAAWVVTQGSAVVYRPSEQCDTSCLPGALPWAPGLTQGTFSWEDDLYRRPGASAHAGSMWGGKTFHNGKWAGLGQERKCPPQAHLVLGYDFKGPCFEIMRPPKKHTGAKNDCKR